MKTYPDVAKVLRAAIDHRGVSQARLREEAGISQRTLTNVLSGAEDFKMSTLFSLADRLGLEMVLVPKSAAHAISAGPVSQPVVKTRVQKALELSVAQERYVNRKG
jgi:lambda repressor-like predicted transcriptional regulator